MRGKNILLALIILSGLAVGCSAKTQSVKDGKEIYHLWRIPLGGAYCSAVCMKHEKSVPKVIFVDTEQL